MGKKGFLPGIFWGEAFHSKIEEAVSGFNDAPLNVILWENCPGLFVDKQEFHLIFRRINGRLMAYE